MQLHLLIVTLVSASITDALQSPHKKQALLPLKRTVYTSQHSKGQPAPPPVAQYLNPKSKPFVVNGSAIPDVPFDAGESYAGTLPISANASDANRLFFWFWPSENPKANDEITIWLNGGPGCSSLDGFFQENGKILWQSGTYQPFLNPYSWTNLTNSKSSEYRKSADTNTMKWCMLTSRSVLDCRLLHLAPLLRS